MKLSSSKQQLIHDDVPRRQSIDASATVSLLEAELERTNLSSVDQARSGKAEPQIKDGDQSEILAN